LSRALLGRRRRVAADVVSRFGWRGERASPRLNLERRIEAIAAGPRQLGSRATQPTIRGESGAEYGPRDRERGDQRESHEHDQHADAHDADGDRGGGETILDCE